MKTVAAARTTSAAAVARRGIRSRPRSPRAIANASTKRAIAVSLNALWARNDAPRYGSAVSDAAITLLIGGSSPSAESAASAVRTAIATSNPSKACSSEAPVPSAASAATPCGPTGYPTRTAGGSGPTSCASQSVQ